MHCLWSLRSFLVFNMMSLQRQVTPPERVNGAQVIGIQVKQTNKNLRRDNPNEKRKKNGWYFTFMNMFSEVTHLISDIWSHPSSVTLWLGQGKEAPHIVWILISLNNKNPESDIGVNAEKSNKAASHQVIVLPLLNPHTKEWTCPYKSSDWMS